MANGNAYESSVTGAVQQQENSAAEQRLAQQRAEADAQQQALKQQSQPSWYNTLFDNMWTDNFQAVPLAGPVAHAVSTGVSAVYNKVNQAGSWLASAAPGGQATYDWDKAGEISIGQAAVSELMARWKDPSGGNQIYKNIMLQNAAPLTVGAAAIPVFDPANPLNKKSFDVTDPTQRDAAFSEGPAKYVSGATDFAASWFLDPFVIGGKALKVARFGSEAMGTLGFTNRAIVSEKAAKVFDTVAQEALSHVEGTGGRANNLTVLGEAVAKAQTVDEARAVLKPLSHPLYSNPHMDLLTSIAVQAQTPRDGVIFLAAAGGNKQAVNLLRQEWHSSWDAMARAKAPSAAELAQVNVPLGAHFDMPAISGQALEPGVDAQALFNDLLARHKYLSDAVDATHGGDVLLTGFGSRSVTGAKVAAAWRAGKSGRDANFLERKAAGDGPLNSFNVLTTPLEERVGNAKAIRDANPSAFTLTDRPRPYAGLDLSDLQARGLLSTADAQSIAAGRASWGTGPAAYERVFQASSGFRRVRIWSALTGQHATGQIAIKGISMNDQVDELHAYLSDSRTIRNDPAFRAEQMRIWSDASLVNETARLQAVQQIEKNVLTRLGQQYGVDPDRIEKVYGLLDAKRKNVVDSFNSRSTNGSRAYGIDPESGDLIALDPVLTSQLESHVPMLDARLLEHTAKLLSEPKFLGVGPQVSAITGERLWHTTEQGKAVLDSISSLWKASVLLRLGYTVRNAAEGYARTAAVLGMLPGLMYAPKAMRNVLWNNRSFSARGRALAHITDAQQSAASSLTALQQVEKMVRDDLHTGAATGRDLAPMQETLDAVVAQRAAVEQHIASLAKERASKMPQYLGDAQAFKGTNGELWKSLASADATTRNALESIFGRRLQEKLDSQSWVRVDPTDSQYWHELQNGVVQFKNDEAATRVLNGDSLEELSAWMNSPAASAYRKQMGLRKVETAGKAVEVHDMVSTYLPTDAARKLAAQGTPTPDELQALLGGLKDRLSPVHGRDIEQRMAAPFSLRNGLNTVFKWLGTKPEDNWVRFPFYNEVWTRRVGQLEDMARTRGLDLAEPKVQASIERQAHAYALKQTEDTLYTINRLSNPAAALKFIAPFFPAWENSMRTWLGIMQRDPSVAARLLMVFNSPFKMGLVTDQNGKKVDSDILGLVSGSPNEYIRLPSMFADGIAKLADSPLGSVPVVGSVLRGANAMGKQIPMSSFNVIAPGSSAWLPGFGPMATVPVQTLLANKPNAQQWLKGVLGDTLYQQVVPFGAPAGGLTENLVANFLPSTAKKAFERWQGTDNANYVKTADAIMQAAMVDWYKNGAIPADKPTVDGVLQKVNDFYLFGMFASLTLPVSLTKMSKYQPQIDYWNNLNATSTLPYQQKVQKFIDKYGESFLPMITSSSDSAAKNLNPTHETFNVLNNNSDLAARLVTYGPETLGMLGASAPLGQFDPGVYQWYLSGGTPGNPGTNLKSTLTPAEMQSKIALQGAWSDFSQAKQILETELQKRGGVSLESSAAADLKAAWTQYTDVVMVDKYGSDWAVAYNDYQQNAGKYLEGAVTILNDKKFMASPEGQSPLWSTVRNYVEGREAAQQAVRDGADSTEMNKRFSAWANELRFSSLQFADFFDNYLANDKLSIGVSRLGN